MENHLPRDIWMSVASCVQDNADLQSVLKCCSVANDLRDDPNLYGLRLVRQHGVQYALEKLAQNGFDSTIAFLLGFGTVTLKDLRTANLIVWTCKPHSILDDRMPSHEAVLRRGLAIESSTSMATNVDTAMWWACRNGHGSLARMLLQARASLTARREETFKPLRMTDSVTIRSFAFDVLVLSGPDRGVTALHAACKYGHIGIVELLLQRPEQRSVLLTEKDDVGNTALHTACKYATQPLIDLLLSSAEQRDEVLMARNGAGMIPLHMACMHGRHLVVEALLSHATQRQLMLTARSVDGYLPIHMACMYKYPAIVDCLLKSERTPECVTAQLRATHMQSRQTALHYAAQAGDRDSALHILCAATSINRTVLTYTLLASNAYGDNAVHLCTKNGHAHVMEVLFKAARISGTPELLKQQLTARNIHLAAPIHLACKFGFDSVVKLLLQTACYTQQRRELLTMQNRGGSTAMYLACKYGNKHVAKVLLDSTPDPKERFLQLTMPKSDGFTPLHTASRFGHEDIVELLLESVSDAHNKQAMLMIRATEDMTPLLMACICCKQGVVDSMLRLAPDPRAIVYQMSITSMQVELPLHWAVKSNYVAIVCAITRAASMIDKEMLMHTLLARNDNGYTPLHTACSVGRVDMVKVLLGIAPDEEQRWRMLAAHDRDGHTPLDIAQRYNHEQVIDLLSQEDEVFESVSSDVSSEVSADD